MLFYGGGGARIVSRIFFTHAKGGPAKIVIWPSQIDSPPPAKNDISLMLVSVKLF